MLNGDDAKTLRDNGPWWLPVVGIEIGVSLLRLHVASRVLDLVFLDRFSSNSILNYILYSII